MSLLLDDARLDVHLPGNTSTNPADADLQVHTPDFEQLGVSPRMQNLVDQGEITIRNPDGVYTGEIRSGARIEFYIKRETEATMTRVWTGMVRNVSHTELGANQYELGLTADDFVFGVLDTRRFTGAFEDVEVAGEEGGQDPDAEFAVLNTVLRERAEEIDRRLINAAPELVTPVYNGKKLLDITKELADRVDAIVTSTGTRLSFEYLDQINPLFTLTDADRGLASTTANDDGLANSIRVNGGKGSSVDSEIEGPPADRTRVTDTSRMTYHLRTRKSSLSSVEVWTNTVDGSTDDIIVRLHPNDPDTGTPLDVEDRESDYTSRRLSQEFLAGDDLTTFLMPEHTLSDRDPWLIIEGSGSTGQNVGVDAAGDPVYRAWFPYPIDVIVQSNDSIADYRRREAVMNKDALSNRQEVIDFARSVRRHTEEPDREMEFVAESHRAHLLEPGDIITVDEPHIEAVGDYIVTVVDHSYEGLRLDTTITAQDTDTV